MSLSLSSLGAERAAPHCLPVPAVDFAALKARQQTVWASGDFAVIGATLQLAAEALCEAADLRAGSRVLDVACGHGNTAIAAARRFCEVSGVDYVPALLERARERARAERFAIEFLPGDAEQLPFEAHSFDRVLSSYGVIFAPRQEVAAAELLRVCRPGGCIALANWTPQGFVGEVFALMSSFVAPPAGVASPFEWGTEAGLERLLGGGRAELELRRTSIDFRYRSPVHWLETFRSWYGPTRRVFEQLEPQRRAELERALLELVAARNRADDGTLVVPAEYLEVVARKR